MRVEVNGAPFDLGVAEATPTISMTDFSRRETDDFGVTTVVPRAFSRKMSVRLAVPFGGVDALQRRLSSLRSTSAVWIADAASEWLSVEGFYKEFSIDVASKPLSYCTLSIEGLAETEIVTDPGGDPAPGGMASTLFLIQPADVTTPTLASSTVPETDYAEWSAITTYPAAARVIRASKHRIYESVGAGNLNHDPAAATGEWIDIGPTNRWAMFDQALGTVTSAPAPVVVALTGTGGNAVALLDVVGTSVRVYAAGYDTTLPVTNGSAVFLDLPPSPGPVTVTVNGSGTVSVGTLLIGRLVRLGVTEASPTAGITDYSRKVTDEFGEVTVAERAWAKRMTTNALIRTDAIDLVANRIATVRATPSLWIGNVGTDALTIYGFFKDFSIARGEATSMLALSVEGLSKAAPLPAAAVVLVPRGPYDSLRSYAAGNLVEQDGSQWEYIGEAASVGNAPPTLPTESNAFWRLFARGASGEPGQTPRLHFAYANAPDGTVDFILGAPAGRAYEGRYIDYVEADSLNPAAYVWREYKGPPFGLTARGTAVIAGSSIIKNAGSSDWDSDAFSTVGYRGGAVASFRAGQTNANVMAGLNADPASSVNYQSLDFAWYFNEIESRAYVYESSENRGIIDNYDTADVFQIKYDGVDKVEYLKNGIVRRSVSGVGADRLFYFDTSLYTPGSRIKDISFVPSGSDGVNGSNAPLLRVQWSVTGTGNWHDTYAVGDLYLRQSNDNGATYGPAVRAVGEDGEDGVGEDGTSPAQIFRRSATVPPTPATNTGNPPPGWSDGPPDGTTYIWQSSAKFRGTVQLTPWSTPQRISGLDGASAPLLRTQWSTTGTGGWHETFAPGDLYLRQSNDNGVTYGPAVRVVGEAAEGGVDGISPSQIFLRSPSVPGTPVINSGNPPPGWSDGPPAGTAYIWQSSAQFRGPTQLTAWSAPQRISGLDGQPGTSAPLLRTQWSVNGTSGWHDAYAVGDLYQRQSNDNGATYGPAIRVVGEDGEGEDGISPSQVFIRSPSVPGTPATNTGNPPTGWSDGPPPGTDFIWQSSARFRETVQLTPWTTPQRISGADGAAGVSPSVVSLNKATLTFAADSNGVVKAGQQPQYVQGSYKTGTDDHTGAATWMIVSASSSASVTVDAAGAVTITDVTGAGEATVRGTFGGVTPQDQTFNWTRPKDPPPPASASSLSAYPDGRIQSTTTTFPAAPITTLTINSSASGQLHVNLSLSHFANPPGGTQPYNFNIAGYIGYRLAASGGAFTGFSQGAVTGLSSASPGQYIEPASEGSLNIDQTQTDLSGNTAYEVGFFLRRVFSTRSTSADFNGTFTVNQP